MSNEGRDASEVLEDLQSDAQQVLKKMNDQAAATEAAKSKQTTTRGQKVFGGLFTVFMGLVLVLVGFMQMDLLFFGPTVPGTVVSAGVENVKIAHGSGHTEYFTYEDRLVVEYDYTTPDGSDISATYDQDPSAVAPEAGSDLTVRYLSLLPAQAFVVGVDPPSFWLALLLPGGALLVWLGFVIVFPRKKEQAVPSGTAGQ